jgi:hypothetical protein
VWRRPSLDSSKRENDDDDEDSGGDGCDLVLGRRLTIQLIASSSLEEYSC